MCWTRKCKCGAAVFVRTFHTLVVLGVPATLLYKDSVLHRCLVDGEHILIGVLYAVMVIWSLTMYYVTCFTNPGYINLSRRKTKGLIKPSNNSDDEVDNDEDVVVGINNNEDMDDGNGSGEENGQMLPAVNKTGIKYRVCDYCEITQPMRTKHCEDCNKCVRKFDHHCPWLEACIGERNHRYFWLFLLSTFILIVCTLYITWNAFEFKVFWSDWMESNAVLLIDTLILCLGGLVVFGLLTFHSYLMFRGLTTWEAASRERITYLKYLDEDYNPFNEGLCKNLYQFLCACHMRRWEKVYARKARGTNGVV